MNNFFKKGVCFAVLTSIISVHAIQPMHIFANGLEVQQEEVQQEEVQQEEVQQEEVQQEEVQQEEVQQEEVQQEEVQQEEVQQEEVQQEEVQQEEVQQEEVQQEEVQQEEVQQEEVQQEEVQQEVKSSKKGFKGKLGAIWTIVISLPTVYENFKFYKDAFTSIRYTFKVIILGLTVPTWEKQTWVGTNCDNISRYVKKVQEILNLEYPSLDKLSVDGLVGSLTIGRIKKYQRDVGITADGACGETTYKYILRLQNQ